MSVNLSIKNVPDEWAEKLRKRAGRSHRSLQGELMAILEEALSEERPLTPAEALNRVRDLKLETGSEARDMVRADRDSR